ncbi:MAG: hypothetical protein JWM21_605 [Acidobacteria bacterium]|nr:hypothetical protein [Acidobacteriota bacterium]
MNRLLIKFLGVAAFSLVTLSANAQTPPAVPASTEVPDFGSVSGTTYANNYFGLTLTFPAGWSVQDSNFKKQISDRGKEIVTSDDPTKKNELNKAVDNTLNLLTVTERPPGSPGPLNSMFLCGAEKFPTGVKTDAGYMLALKNTLQYSQAPITIERDVYTEQIGGVPFAAIDFKTDFSGVIVNQKYFAHIRKDYVLFFIVTYDTPDQLKTHTDILRSVVLK